MLVNAAAPNGTPVVIPGACERLGQFLIVEFVRWVFRGTVILQRNDAFRWNIPINGFPLTVTRPPIT